MSVSDALSWIISDRIIFTFGGSMTMRGMDLSTWLSLGKWAYLTRIWRLVNVRGGIPEMVDNAAKWI